MTPSISSSLLLKFCHHNWFFKAAKQVVVTQRKIWAVVRVVKQFSVQKCSSVRSCMWMHIRMKNYNLSQHSTSYVLNDHMQFLMGFRIQIWHYCNPCCMNSTMSALLLAQKTVSFSIFKLYFFVSWMCTGCFNSSLVSTFTNETAVPSSVTHITWLRSPSPYFWYCSAKSKAILCMLCTSMSIFRNHVMQNL